MSNSEVGCILFPTGGALRYAQQHHCASFISDYLSFLWLLQWFQLIIANRPKYDEKVEDLVDVNDIRNGLFATDNVHRAFDPREVAILKVSHFSA
jgi:hypothetical protein